MPDLTPDTFSDRMRSYSTAAGRTRAVRDRVDRSPLSGSRVLSGPGRDILDGALEATVVLSFSRIGYLARRHLYSWCDPPRGSLAGRVAIVTGGSSGLGRATATAMARAGATVHITGRDRERLDAARDDLVIRYGRERVRASVVDLSDLDDVRAFADRLVSRGEPVDALVHNAGALNHTYRSTVDGLERTAQVHVVAPFLLTAELLPLLHAADASKVVSVASGGMYTARLNTVALDSPPHSFDGVRAYAQAKRAQVVLSACWAERTRGSTISFAAMHPGWVDTPGLRAALPRFRRLIGPLIRTPEQGADTIVWLAATESAGTVSGEFWLDRRIRSTIKVPGTSAPAGEAERLWAWCSAGAGLSPGPDLGCPAASMADTGPESAP